MFSSTKKKKERGDLSCVSVEGLYRKEGKMAIRTRRRPGMREEVGRGQRGAVAPINTSTELSGHLRNGIGVASKVFEGGEGVMPPRS